MGDVSAVLAAVAVTCGYGLVVLALSRLARSARRRGVGGSVIGVFDEIWHPAAVAPRIAVDQQHARRHSDSPAADPPWLAQLPELLARRGTAASADVPETVGTSDPHKDTNPPAG